MIKWKETSNIRSNLLYTHWFIGLAPVSTSDGCNQFYQTNGIWIKWAQKLSVKLNIWLFPNLNPYMTREVVIILWTAMQHLYHNISNNNVELLVLVAFLNVHFQILWIYCTKDKWKGGRFVIKFHVHFVPVTETALVCMFQADHSC